MGELELLREKIGLSESKAKETLKNAQVTKNLLACIAEADKFGKLDKDSGILLYHLASKIKAQIIDKLGFVTEYIVNKKLDTTQRVEAALAYLLSNIRDNVNIREFEEACGVGVVVTPEQIEAAVEKAIKNHLDDIKEQRYRFNSGLLMAEIRAELKWASGESVKNEIGVQMIDILGPKTAEDEAPVGKNQKTKAKAADKAKAKSIKKDDKNDKGTKIN
ncbi:probable glutamine--tRNA ligase [Cotesia glomerata]|uniref:probable glutamine--tRNA ligase n=1 Tax=Cotesia glomerata TaxID=32391 RepID=UPI001D00EE67|nr:probable glutamine--tRNA ligase [Cotesia glomerata]